MESIFKKIDFESMFKDEPLVKKNVQEMYRLPSEIRFCKKCVISNQRPRIVFNEKGVCNACEYAERKNQGIDWKKREKELVDLLARFRKKDGYDILIPGSGGKDSSYVSHILKHKYGMHPLTVTWAPHIYTEIGWRNYQAWLHSGFDNVMGTANGIIHRVLTRLTFERMAEPFQPFIYGQSSFPLRIAVKYRIPLIMHGENGEIEYGGDKTTEAKSYRDFSGEFTKNCWSNVNPEFWQQAGIDKRDLYPYTMPSLDELKDVGVEFHYFSYFHKWIPQENYYYSIENTNFVCNPERSEGTYSKYASLDDRIDGFHYYMMFIKFGIGRATSDAAHEVRDGHLTRKEAVNLVRKYDGEFPQKNFKMFLEYTGLTEERFWQIVDCWRADHIWEKSNGQWKLRKQVEDLEGELVTSAATGK